MGISRRGLLLQSLAVTIADYRQNEIAPIKASHVERWLNQFDESDQMVILEEMDMLMKRFYFSKNRVKESIRAFLKERVLKGRNPVTVLPHVSFLRIQTSGSSQIAMLELVDEILQEDYNCPLSMIGSEEIHTYIYVDDGIYTGNKLRYDLTDSDGTTGWISLRPSSQCGLLVYTIAGHKAGIDYVRNHLKSAADRKDMRLLRDTTLMIENTREFGVNIEVLWPERIPGDTLVDSYVFTLGQVRVNNLFRPVSLLSMPERFFSSGNARRVIEQAFLKKGIQIVQASQNPAPSMRPLGYMKLSSLGFGTLFVTYRNIANNCPLVLWWGDPSYLQSHPLGMWYPLFPRRTNAVRDILQTSLSEEQIFDDDTFFDDHPF